MTDIVTKIVTHVVTKIVTKIKRDIMLYDRRRYGR